MIPLDDNSTALNVIQYLETCDLCPAKAAWRFLSPTSGFILQFCSHHSSSTPIPPDWQEIPL